MNSLKNRIQTNGPDKPMVMFLSVVTVEVTSLQEETVTILLNRVEMNQVILMEGMGTTVF